MFPLKINLKLYLARSCEWLRAYFFGFDNVNYFIGKFKI